MTKEEIISDLYGLRSGLSLISQNCDKVKSYENGLSNDENLLRNEENEIRNLENEIYQNNETIRALKEKEVIDLEKMENSWSLRAGVKKSERRLRNHKSFFKFWIILCVLCVLTVAGAWGVGWEYFEFYMQPAYREYHVLERVVVIIITAIGAVLPILIFLISKSFLSISCNKSLKKIYNEHLDAKESYKISVKQQIVDIELRNTTLFNIINNHKQNHALSINKAQQNKTHYNNEITLTANNSKEIANALNETYGKMLVDADWENVDLVIFYMESGRADSIKEALYQVDRQRQTDTIAREIRHAISAISNTINTGLKSLGNAIAKSFSVLSSQISSGFAKIGNQINLHNKLAEEQINLSRQQVEQNVKIISATELNNALAEKANRSSDELLYDLRYQQKYWYK